MFYYNNKKLTGRDIKKYLSINSFDTKHISVTTSSNVIYVTYLSNQVEVTKLRDLLSCFENYDMDEVTGEILSCPGNSYVFIQKGF